MSRPSLCALVLALSLAFLPACSDDGGGPVDTGATPGDETGDDGACEGEYPDAGETIGIIVHVNASCAAEGADGSLEAPYPDLGSALEDVAEDTTIVVAPGTYEENLLIETDGVQILGGEAAGIILHAPDPTLAAVRVDGAEGVVLNGLHVHGASVAGVWVDGGSATLSDCIVMETATDEDGAFGFGVLTTEAIGIIVHRTSITGSEGIGLMIQGGTAAPELTELVVTGNAGGGIRLEDVAAGGTLTDSTVEGNSVVGLGIFSSQGIIVHRTTITGTTADEAGAGGDGVVVAELFEPGGVSHGAAEVTFGATADDANTVDGNARVGLLMSGETRGIIVHNEVGDNAHAGVWLQTGAGATEAVMIESNAVSGNTFLGVALLGGARAELTGNTVSATEAGSFIDPGSLSSITMGDGVGLFDLAAATITDNTFSDNARAGVLGDALAGADTSLTGNSYSGNALGAVVLQHTAADGAGEPAATDEPPTVLSDAEAVGVHPTTETGIPGI